MTCLLGLAGTCLKGRTTYLSDTESGCESGNGGSDSLTQNTEG